MPELKLHEGDRFPVERLSRPLERRTIVFFYPVAFTGGCTREVRRFNELLPEFDRAGVDVIGASMDTSERNGAFAEAEGLAYDLDSDPTAELTDELGIVIDIENYGLRSARYTYLLEADGTILRIWQVGGGDAIDAHPDEVLEAVSDPVV